MQLRSCPHAAPHPTGTPQAPLGAPLGCRALEYSCEQNPQAPALGELQRATGEIAKQNKSVITVKYYKGKKQGHKMAYASLRGVVKGWGGRLGSAEGGSSRTREASYREKVKCSPSPTTLAFIMQMISFHLHHHPGGGLSLSPYFSGEVTATPGSCRKGPGHRHLKCVC